MVTWRIYINAKKSLFLLKIFWSSLSVYREKKCIEKKKRNQRKQQHACQRLLLFIPKKAKFSHMPLYCITLMCFIPHQGFLLLVSRPSWWNHKSFWCSSVYVRVLSRWHTDRCFSFVHERKSKYIHLSSSAFSVKNRRWIRFCADDFCTGSEVDGWDLFLLFKKNRYAALVDKTETLSQISGVWLCSTVETWARIEKVLSLLCFFFLPHGSPDGRRVFFRVSEYDFVLRLFFPQVERRSCAFFCGHSPNCRKMRGRFRREGVGWTGNLYRGLACHLPSLLSRICSAAAESALISLCREAVRPDVVHLWVWDSFSHLDATPTLS